MPEILKNIRDSCLFWLDAHWSGGNTSKGELQTPIMQELEAVLNHSKSEDHIVLIDDARFFTGKNDYPTLERLEQFVLGIHSAWTFEVKDDIIRIHSCKVKE